MLTTPDVQELAMVPPPLDVAMERSYDGESSVKLPPVEEDTVMRTLVAFICKTSAAEPVAMVSVVAGETVWTDSAVWKLRGAA